MSAALNCRLIRYLADHRGRLWDRNYLHLIGPAMITLGTDGHGKIAVQGATSYKPASATANLWSTSHGLDLTAWTRFPATVTPAQGHGGIENRNHTHLSQRRLGPPQGEAKGFFNSLLGE